VAKNIDILTFTDVPVRAFHAEVTQVKSSQNKQAEKKSSLTVFKLKLQSYLYIYFIQF